MTLRNVTPITNVALAVAVIALAAPMAQSQSRAGRVTPHINSGMFNQVYSNNNGSMAGALYGYTPFTFGANSHRNNNTGVFYAPGGALVLGSDGQLYNPFLNNGAVEPTYRADGVTIPAPVAQNKAVSNPLQLSDQIDAVQLPGNMVRIAWSGDQGPVARMQFSLLSSNRTVLRNSVVTALPAEAIFSRPATAKYYRVIITYGDGAVRSIVAPL